MKRQNWKTVIRAIILHKNYQVVCLIFAASLFLGFLVPAGQPPNQPTAITFSSRTVNSISVSFTNAAGNPNGYLLIYKSGLSPTNGAPVDGTTYNVGDNLGGGTVGGRGNAPFNVTGLTAGQQYFFDIYSYNGPGGGYNYLQSVNPLEGSAWTLAAAPTGQPTNLVFNTITSTGFNVSFTDAVPVPSSGYFVLRHAGTAVVDAPQDGIGYSVGSIIGTSTVAFIGPSVSFTESALASVTIYNYKIFSYAQASDPTSVNYATSGTPLVGSQSTVASPATIQSTNVTFSAAVNSITLNWTNGNGARRIVLGHAISPVSANPTNTATYVSNAVFSSGTQIGAGNYVVYDGTGNSVTVTSLSSATDYYFQVFEYNGTGSSTNYLTLTAVGNPAMKTTLAIPATIQSSNISFSGVVDTQMTLNWTGGNGTRRVVLGHSGALVNSNPVSGTIYSANAQFTSGNQVGTENYVVYDGTGNSVTITGLTASTLYNFQVFEYTGTGSSANYMTSTSAGNPGGQITFAPPVLTQATNILFSGINDTALTLNWINGSGATRLVVAHSGTAVNSNPANAVTYSANATLGSGSQIGTGNYVVYDGTGSSVTVNGLTPAMIFYFEVFEYNGATGSENYKTNTGTGNPANQTTLTGAPNTQATAIAFSGLSNNQATLNWTNGNGSTRLVLLHQGSMVDSNPINATVYSANAVFGSGGQIGNGNYVVYYGTGNSVTITGLANSTPYYAEVFESNGSGATTNFLSTTAAGNPAGQSTLAPPSTAQSTNISYGGFNNNKATLTWANGNGSNRMVVAHAFSSIDSSPLNGTSYTANSFFGNGTQIGQGNFVVYVGAGNTVTVTGLTSSSQYYFRIFEYNGNGIDNNFNTVTAAGNPSQTLTLTDAPLVDAITLIDSVSFMASWSPVIGGVNYRVDVSIDNFSTFVNGYNNLIVAGTSLVVNGLSAGSTYVFRARAENGTGPSSNSNLVSVTFTPPPPTLLLCTNVTDVSFTTSWGASNGATDYFLDVATDINFGSILPLNRNRQITGAQVAAVTGLSSGTMYYCRVRSANVAGGSVNSSTVSQITVPAAPVALNSSNEQQDNFIANWTEVTGAVSYELDVTLSSSNFSTFVTNYASLNIPDATQTQEVITGLASNTVYKYRIRARNTAGVSGNSSSKVALTLGGIVLPPTISVTDASITEIKAQTSGGFNGATNTITFVHRTITSTTFKAEPAITGSGADILVNPEWLDQIGIEYYFRVSDEAEKKDSTESQYLYVNVAGADLGVKSDFASGGTAQSYRIFSIPLQLSSNRIEDIFQPIEAQYGGIDKSKWRLVQYQNGHNIDYGAGLNTIEPGRSYWFNSINQPQSISVSGKVTEANQSKGFVLSLDAGFTQIGNPYPFNISWNDIISKNANVEGIEGVGSLYTYDASHVTFNKESPLLMAWGGGFVHSDSPIQITIPVTTLQQARIAAGDRNGIENRSIDQLEWFVPIRIQQGAVSNNYSGPGMHPDAQSGFDRFDDFTLPRFVSHLEMNSYHSEYHTPRFSRDVVPTATHHNWEFNVESNFDDHQAEINWDNFALGNNSAQLLLYDAEANMIVDMKKTGTYRFEIREKHLFKIFFGVDEKSISPDITGLGRAYPNPFIQNTTIPFITSEDRPMVQIALYDLMGKKIRDVVNGKFEPGAHEGTWDGTDELGGRVAQGMYLYRLTGTDVTPETGRIILK